MIYNPEHGKLLPLLTFLCISFLNHLPSYAAGSGTTTPDPTTGNNSTTNTNPLQSPTPLQLQPIGTNTNSSSYYGFGGYSSSSSCGIQAYINGSAGKAGLSQPYPSSSTLVTGESNISNLSIQAGVVFNSQKCIDPNKQLQSQENIIKLQTQTQLTQTRVQICGSQRTELVKQNPTITKARLDEICPLE
jgi:hypothetical protein